MSKLFIYIEIMKSTYLDIIKTMTAKKEQEAENGEKTEQSDNLTDSDETPVEKAQEADSDIPLKCLKCPCWREYPYCAACIVDIGGNND